MDFDLFEPGSAKDETLEFSLKSPRTKAPPQGLALIRTPACRAFGIGRERNCEYVDGTLLFSSRERGKERFEIHGDTAEGIHETAWETILSALGEALDRKGAHRVHALGIELGGRAGLLIMPSGGGKSTLASLCAKQAGPIRILSDESPLVYDDKILPFPLRFALEPAAAEGMGREGRIFQRRRFPAKMLFALDAHRVGRASEPAFLLLGSRRRAAEARIRGASRFLAWAELTRSLVVGIGIAQMREHLLRLENLPVLARVFLSRLRAATRLAWTIPVFRLETSTDPERTWAALDAFVKAAIMKEIELPNSDADFHPASERFDGGEPQVEVPEDLGGLPLGGREPAPDVRGSERRIPEHP
jgi:hypothetical protein